MLAEEVHGLAPGDFRLVLIEEIEDMACPGTKEEFTLLFERMEFLTEMLYLLQRGGPIFFSMNQQHRRPDMVRLMNR